MRFILGGRTYDLTHRPLVIGRLDPTHGPDDARQLAAEGADVLEVADPGDVAAVVAAAGLPVAIAADRLDAVRAAYQAGAVLGTCPDRGLLALSVQAGASVVVTDPAPALAAGLPADRIAVARPIGRPAAAVARPVASPVAPARPAVAFRPAVPPATQPTADNPAPFPVVVTTDDFGEAAVAVTNGARLIRTTEVRAARRVADVLAAILEAGP